MDLTKYTITYNISLKQLKIDDVIVVAEYGGYNVFLAKVENITNEILIRTLSDYDFSKDISNFLQTCNILHNQYTKSLSDLDRRENIGITKISKQYLKDKIEIEYKKYQERINNILIEKNKFENCFKNEIKIINRKNKLKRIVE